MKKILFFLMFSLIILSSCSNTTYTDSNNHLSTQNKITKSKRNNTQIQQDLMNNCDFLNSSIIQSICGVSVNKVKNNVFGGCSYDFKDSKNNTFSQVTYNYAETDSKKSFYDYCISENGLKVSNNICSLDGNTYIYGNKYSITLSESTTNTKSICSDEAIIELAKKLEARLYSK